MLRIDRKQKQFTQLSIEALADALITERYDLQEYIFRSPEAFCKEIGQTLFLIGKEIQPSDAVQDRIDLLALDQEGNAVIIELKRGNHKLHLLQAISYAGMIAHWEPEDFLEFLDEEAIEKLQNFLEVDTVEINRQQRIILVAEAFDYSVLVSAEWLNERFDVSILCCRLSLVHDQQTNTEYVVCTNVFPAPEIARQAVGRGRVKPLPNKRKWSDWDSALSNISNSAVVAYFKQELAVKRDSYLLRRLLKYSINGKRTWFLAARIKNAYAWQYARFDGDTEFWQKGLSHPEEVGPVKEGTCLRFFLYSKDDFNFFHNAVTKEMQAVEWSDGVPEEEDFTKENEDE